MSGLLVYLIIGLTQALLDFIESKVNPQPHVDPGLKLKLLCWFLITILWPVYIIVLIVIPLYQLVKKGVRMTNKYEKLDQLILNQMGSKPKPFCDLFTGDVLKESEELSVHKNEGFRVLDRRLQALRKKGLIANISSSKGWVKL